MPLTILLADDSMTAQNMGKKILIEAGYDVVAVSNGAAAVKKIAERKPDLAVLDVYMPGYTGLEVCERVKTALETSAMPVLLTVGKMEIAFKPEDASRVRADGVIMKPFEAKDLLSAVQKLEQKISVKGKIVATPADPGQLPEYERTVKIAAPVFDDQDESYKAWTSQAPAEEPAVKVPTGMQAAPAFADELGSEQHVTSRYTAPTEPIEPQVILKPAEAAAAEPAPAGEPEPSGVGKLLSKAKGWFGGSSAEEPATPAFAEEELQAVAPSPEPAADYSQTIRVEPATETVREFERVQSYGATEAAGPAAAPAPEPAPAPPTSSAAEDFFAATVGGAPPESLTAAAFEPTSSQPVEVEASAAPGFEPTSAPASESEHEHAAAPGFEATSERHEGAAFAGTDSALITDVSEMSTAFPTKFGVEGAEPVHVGIASEFPELYTPPQTEAPPTEQAPAPELEAPQAISETDFDQKVASAMEAGWAAEEAPLEEHEHSVSLHQEMQQQMAQSAPAPEPAPAPEEAHVHVEAASVHGQNAPDHELAAAMAAAVGSQIEPVVAAAIEQTAVGDTTQAMDQHTAVIAEIVQRVTERIKPELIEQITRELAELKKKKS